MPIVTPTAAKPRLWLAITAILALVSIGVLWPLREASHPCILTYPAPPNCGGETTGWIPLAAIGLVIAICAAAVVAYATASRSRIALMILAASIVAVTVLGVVLALTGSWYPPQPYPPVFME
jgi:hypothetical protein